MKPSKQDTRVCWRWMGIKFRAMWGRINIHRHNWVRALIRTLYRPFQRRKQRMPRIQVSFVCPLDMNGRKPDRGTREASQCFKALSLSKRDMHALERGEDPLARHAHALAETQKQLNDMRKRNDMKEGVFVEIGLAANSPSEVDSDEAELRRGLEAAAQGTGDLHDATVTQMANPGLIIDPLRFIQGNKNFEDTTQLHDESCTKATCNDADTGGHRTKEIEDFEEPPVANGGTSLAPPTDPKDSGKARESGAAADTKSDDESSSSLNLLIPILVGAGICAGAAAVAMYSTQKNRKGQLEFKELATKMPDAIESPPCGTTYAAAPYAASQDFNQSGDNVMMNEMDTSRQLQGSQSQSATGSPTRKGSSGHFAPQASGSIAPAAGSRSGMQAMRASSTRQPAARGIEIGEI